MYNRYVFEPDGSCRRDRVEEKCTPEPEPEVSEPPQQDFSSAQCCQENCQFRRQSPLDFLRQMLPQGFDTGDLIVVLLLLLMAGDCREDRDNALLTLALYFIL